MADESVPDLMTNEGGRLPGFSPGAPAPKSGAGNLLFLLGAFAGSSLLILTVIMFISKDRRAPASAPEDTRIHLSDRLAEMPRPGGSRKSGQAGSGQGDPAVHTEMGKRYMTGDGVEKNMQVAFEWFQKGAKAGHPESQYYLGLLYMGGQGTEQNTEEGFKWLRNASINGYAEADDSLARMDGTKNDHLSSLTAAAEKGNAQAQLDLAELYLNGERVKQDDDLAFKWAKMAAERGLPRAQHMVGSLYLAGRGTPADSDEGIMWIKVAANKGFGPSQEMIRQMPELFE